MCHVPTSVSSIFGAKIQIFMILWNFPAFCGILQSIAEHFGFLRNFTEFRRLLRNIADFAEFC